MRASMLGQHAAVAGAADTAVARDELGLGQVFRQVADRGNRSASTTPAAMRACSRAASRTASSPKRVPARSAARSLKLKPLPPRRASASSFHSPTASASGVPASAARSGRDQEVQREVLALRSVTVKGCGRGHW